MRTAMIRLGGCQSDLSLCWAHMPFCWFCHVVAHFSYFFTKTYIVGLSRSASPSNEYPRHTFTGRIKKNISSFWFIKKKGLIGSYEVWKGVTVSQYIGKKL